MRGAAPGSARVLAVGIAKGDVDSGELLVLQNVADNALDAQIRANSKLADAVGVLVGVGVGPKVGFELLVCARATDDAVACDLNCQRSRVEETISRAQPIANNAVHNKGSVDLAGRGEALAAWQVAPLLRRDDAGGLEPFVSGIHFGGNISAGSGGGANADGAANPIQNLLAEPVNKIKVRSHALAHDLWRDVDHMSMAHVAAVDYVGHLHARVEFIGLHLDRKDRYLRGFHIGEHLGGHVDERARGKVFEDERVPIAATLGELRGKSGGDGLGDAIGDERDLFRGVDAQARGSGRDRSRLEFRGVVKG